MSKLESCKLLESLSEQWKDRDNPEGPSKKFFVAGKVLHTYEQVYCKNSLQICNIDDRFSILVGKGRVFVVDRLNGHQASSRQLKIIDQSNFHSNLAEDRPSIRLIWSISGVCGYFFLCVVTDKKTQNSFLTVVELSLLRQEFIILLAHPTQMRLRDIFVLAGRVTKEHKFWNLIVKVRERLEFYRITLDLGDANTELKLRREPELIDDTVVSRWAPPLWIDNGKIYSFYGSRRTGKVELNKLVVLPFDFTVESVPEYLELRNCKIQFEGKQILRHVSCSDDHFFIIERKPTLRLLLKLDLNLRIWVKITRLPFEMGVRNWFFSTNEGHSALYSIRFTESKNLRLRLNECRRVMTSNPDTLVQLAFSKAQKLGDRNVTNPLANYEPASTMLCLNDGFKPCFQLIASLLN